MSANKSWDITPSRKPSRPAAPAARPPQRRFDDIRPTAPKKPAPAPVRAAPPVPTRREAVRKSSPAPRAPLRARRKQARTRIATFAVFALLVVLGLMLAALWQPWLRVGTVAAKGPDADKLEAFVQTELVGTRFYVVPKNSIFFIPQQEIRAHILAAFPQVEAVSIAPAGLTTLAVTASPRASVMWWCGQSIGEPSDSCYEADAQGLVFAPVPLDQRFATDSALSLYAPLDSDIGSSSPIGRTVKSASSLPQLIQFVKAMKELNANVVSVDIRGDEADLYTPAGTRITYVIGREQQAANLAASAFPTLNLNDGSLLYVDLRFDSKVFFKKKGS